MNYWQRNYRSRVIPEQFQGRLESNYRETGRFYFDYDVQYCDLLYGNISDFSRADGA